MNPFDAFVYAVAAVAIIMGFNAGLLRSMVTILGYLVAAPIAVALTPRLMGLVLGRTAIPQDDAWIVLFALFIAVGVAVSALFRTVLGEFVGPENNLFDRCAGAALGAVRIFLVAVLIVVIFDRVIPPDHQPRFLVGSHLRPYLSAAGREGMQTLPPEIELYIDRIKHERGL